jgi:hypothetical protein
MRKTVDWRTRIVAAPKVLPENQPRVVAVVAAAVVA